MFAVEHWQQSLAQRRSQIDVNNLASADAEVIAQVVSQAMGRTELPESMSDEDAVAEVYNLMGLNRLLVTPDSKSYLLDALRAQRSQRAKTLDAWSTIRDFVGSAAVGREVDGDRPNSKSGSHVFEAVNTSLAEYDLPTSMTDEAVLSELFSLLEVPRDAVNFRSETVLLDAIRTHRAVRSPSVCLASLSCHHILSDCLRTRGFIDR